MTPEERAEAVFKKAVEWGGKASDFKSCIAAALRETELQNGLLIEIARLSWNERYSHTAPEADTWALDLREALDALPKEITDKIAEANKPEKR